MRRISRLAIIALTASISFLVHSEGWGQTIGTTKNYTCDALKKEKKLGFEIIRERKNDLPPFMVMSDIVVRKRDFTRSNMERLAKTLTARYCGENQVSVAIFDERGAALKLDMFEYLMGRTKSQAVRGFYSLNRDEKRISLSFSSKRGRPTSEVVIEFIVDDW